VDIKENKVKYAAFLHIADLYSHGWIWGIWFFMYFDDRCSAAISI